MSDIKWIKIVTDIFDDEKILLIESLPEADSIIVIWFKLLCLAGKQNNSGVFIMNNGIAYTDKMLATIFRRKEATVKMALDTFQQFGMIEIIEEAITIPNWGKYQSIDMLQDRRDYMRDYMQDYRRRQRGKITSNDSDFNDEFNSKANGKVNSKANVNLQEEEKNKNKSKNKNKEYICSEPGVPAPNCSDIFLPLVDGTFYNVPNLKIEKWSVAFPAVNVKHEILKMLTWLDSNPKKRKTSNGIERFINNWLSRTQDNGGSKTESYGTVQSSTTRDGREIE